MMYQNDQMSIVFRLVIEYSTQTEHRHTDMRQNTGISPTSRAPHVDLKIFHQDNFNSITRQNDKLQNSTYFEDHAIALQLISF